MSKEFFFAKYFRNLNLSKTLSLKLTYKENHSNVLLKSRTQIASLTGKYGTLKLQCFCSEGDDTLWFLSSKYCNFLPDDITVVVVIVVVVVVAGVVVGAGVVAGVVVGSGVGVVVGAVVGAGVGASVVGPIITRFLWKSKRISPRLESKIQG